VNSSSSFGVDRAARQKAALIMRRFLSGTITNDTFENEWPLSQDRAIVAVYTSLWCLYDDFKVHRLVGPHALHPDQQRACLRWLIFLDTDLPYEWPKAWAPGHNPSIRPSFFRGIFNRKPTMADRQAFVGNRNYAVWPFAHRRDYLRALRQPLRLSGGRFARLAPAVS
jgi:hypothetical protein